MKYQQHRPDFLGIGAQKAGTTWLWENLKQQPKIWLTPQKELHYFDRSSSYPSPSYLADKYLPSRLLGKQDYNILFREMLTRDITQAFEQRDWQKLHWYLRYYLGIYNDAWYLSLFTQGQGKIRGEITPAYSILNSQDVQHVKKLMPDLKIIFLLRNPIDRAWSSLRYEWTVGRFHAIDDLSYIKAFIDSPSQILRGNYLRTLEIWNSCFSERQIFVGFFDDIIDRPQNLLVDILKFLGVKNSEIDTTKFLWNRKVNVAEKKEIPQEIEYYLTQQYYPMLEKLSEFLGGASEIWLKKAEKFLKSTSVEERFLNYFYDL